MSYALELDDLRREGLRGEASVFGFWPKVAGEGNVPGAATASYSVYDPAGELVEGPLSAAATDVDGVSRYDLAVGAIATLGEDYSIRVTWRKYGETANRTDVVLFDVVLYPFGPPSISLNDLREERPDIGEVLGRMGLLLGFDDETAAEQMAAVFAVRARVELDALVRDQIRQDASSAADATRAIRAPAGAVGRPNLILNRERLNRVERKLACQLIYFADATNPEGDEEAAALGRYYQAAAESAWRGVGPLRYDASEDLTPDATVVDIGRVVSCRRVQG